MAQTFLLLYAITDRMAVKLKQIDGMLAAGAKTLLAETLSYNSGGYTLLSLTYLDDRSHNN